MRLRIEIEQWCRGRRCRRCSAMYKWKTSGNQQLGKLLFNFLANRWTANIVIFLVGIHWNMLKHHGSKQKTLSLLSDFCFNVLILKARFSLRIHVIIIMWLNWGPFRFQKRLAWPEDGFIIKSFFRGSSN